MSLDLTIGFCLAAMVSTGAVTFGALTKRAALASTALGTVVFAAGSIGWSIPLLTFFATSSLLSRETGIGRAKPSLKDRTTRRTARQVVANGSLPALWALGQLVSPRHIWVILFASAIATAAGDTWATEIGKGSLAPPRDLLTGRRVSTGTSGGVTLLGFAASLAGAAAIAFASLATGDISLNEVSVIAFAGCGGALADSLLGAALQDRRLCRVCRLETEHRLHGNCRTPTVHDRGIPGFDNDWVNLTASTIGSGLGFLLTHIM